MYSSDDIITTDKYLSLASENIVYLKTDLLTYGCDEIEFRGYIIKVKPANVWITGHSDYHIHPALFEKYERNCKFWFTINKACENEKLISLPLGITNNTCETAVHGIYGNTDIMIEVMAKPQLIKNLMYMNFNLRTNRERRVCYELFSHTTWTTKGKDVKTMEGRANFLEEMRNHKFTLCPSGNGPDTHRLWEALYMESIPIVRNQICYKEFQDLPILFVNDWTDITEQFLENKYKEIKGSCWNMDKLKFSYWKERILNASL